MEIINVMASTLDGKIGASRVESDEERIKLGLSSDADRNFLRDEIGQCDGVIVGASSIRANGSCLDWPGLTGQPPHWFIFAQDPLPLELCFWQQHHVPRSIVSHLGFPEADAKGVGNLKYGQQDPAQWLVDYLQKLSFKRVLLFGGGWINGMFYRRNLVDRLHLSLAPLILAKNDAPPLIHGIHLLPIQMSLLTSQHHENFVFLYYQVVRT